MPNQPKTPAHSFRCPDDLWDRAGARAAREGENVSDVLRRFLTRYARGEDQDQE